MKLQERTGVCGFRRRSGNLFFRNPKLTSLGRSIGFNRPVFNPSFNNLKEILREGTLGPHNIRNLDETGISTVVKPNKLFTKNGVKQFAQISLAEPRGDCGNVLLHECC